MSARSYVLWLVIAEQSTVQCTGPLFMTAGISIRWFYCYYERGYGPHLSAVKIRICQVAAVLQTKPSVLGCEYACRLLSTSSIHICYWYSVQSWCSFYQSARGVSSSSLQTFRLQLKTRLFQLSYPHLNFWPFDWHRCSGPCSNACYLGHSKDLCLLTYLPFHIWSKAELSWAVQ